MKFGKKLLAVALAAVLALGMLTACGGGNALVQPDMAKGKEVFEALNVAREKNAEGSSVEWDGNMAVKGTAYANAYADYVSAVLYANNHTEDTAADQKARKAWNTAEEVKQEWLKSLPNGYVEWRIINEEAYENVKADGAAYFEDVRVDGQKLNVVTCAGERAAVTVVRKNDIKVMFVVVWRTQK